ncbi:unnamed protein product [Nippostrongylus brasiliensis]|uniref:Cytoplasmic protein n=1 Tax=Nippostrongylus brasiliensis TaxID=27835 RepID=A0A0N4YXJ2_NIPBR|nr:unnamed protein product [Nippostrongylus brasiliensis]
MESQFMMRKEHQVQAAIPPKMKKEYVDSEYYPTLRSEDEEDGKR